MSDSLIHGLTFINKDYKFVAEFGVFQGRTIKIARETLDDSFKIFGFDSFEGMPNITNKDLGEYNKCDPTFWVGKLNEDGINSVYNTFNTLGINFDNVKLIKGFFEDTITDDVIDELGEIAVLRLDSDWYKSTKFCIEKLYNNVVNNGVILIDDYGFFIGCKNAIDEFRINNNIVHPIFDRINRLYRYFFKYNL